MRLKHHAARSLLYSTFIISGSYDLLHLADWLGEELDNLYKKLNGTGGYPPWEWVPKILSYPELRPEHRAELQRFLLPQAPRQRRTNSLLHEAAELTAAIGRVHQTIVSALDDGRMSETEKRKIRAEINRSREELADIEAALDEHEQPEQRVRMVR